MNTSKVEGSLSISVGIPTMNNETTIETSLRQLAEQTRPPDRVIIVDASDDSTPEKIRSMKNDLDIRIDYYRQSNRGRGVGAARKDIYEHFEEDILVCLDTDHAVEEDWLEIHEQFHTEHKDIEILSNSNRPDFDRSVSDPHQSEFFGQSNCSIKQRALDVVEGWDPWMNRGEDWDMRIRLWTAGMESWAKNEIKTKRFERNVMSDTITWFQKKVTGSPSSVTFLRKYGLWYFRFHPLHVVGDVLSAASLLSLLLVPVGLLIEPLSAVVLLGFPFACSSGYLYYKGPRKRDGLSIRPKDLASLVVFFALGLSALYNLQFVGDGEDWNYAGFDPNQKL